MLDDLKIELAAPPHWTFAPGDTVIGTVVRKNHLVTPKATLDLRLNGHTQTKIDELTAGHPGYPLYSGYYGRNSWPGYGANTVPGAMSGQHSAYWNLLPTWKADMLWNDPLHIAKDEDENWSVPFEVVIPVTPEEGVLKRHLTEGSYLPVDEESLATQVLPGSFCAHRPSDASAGHGACEGSIVYELEAILRYTHGGSPTTIKASCPIVLRHLPQQPPDYKDSKHDDNDNDNDIAHRRSHPVMVQTHRLNPALHDTHTHLSLSQKTQQFFGSSKVPQYTYRVEFGMPRKLTLHDNPTIPLTLAIIPDSHPHKTSRSLHGVTQTFQVRSVRISLDAVTEIRATGEKEIRTAHHVHPHAIVVSMASSPVELIASDEKAASAVDIGALLGLNLCPAGLRRGGSGVGGSVERGDNVNALVPDFTSYLIKHSHKLACEVEVCVGGESVRVHSAVAVVVI